MTGGSVVSITPGDGFIALDIADENSTQTTLKIARTNYVTRIGDYISWNNKTAFWHSQQLPEKEVMLPIFIPELILEIK